MVGNKNRITRTIIGQTYSPLRNLWSFIIWISGVIVSLAVGFGMIGQNGVPVLKVPYIPAIVTVTVGWVVVILTLLGALLAIIDRFR